MGGDDVDAARIKLYITSGVFLLATALKLASPAAALELRERVVPAICADTDYRAAFAALGESVSGLGAEALAALRPAPTEAAKETKEPEPVPSAAPTLGSPADIVEQSLEEPAEPEPSPDAEPADDDAARAERAVAAFLDSQSEYAEFAVPANVSYEAPRLPFEHACPVTADRSSGFGYRLHPISGAVRFHYGTDLGADHGDDIYAFAGGVVYAAYEEETYGKLVMIDHADGWRTLYAHCSELLVLPGQSVSAGELIARVGETGNATGPHLHFELMCEGVYYNPEFILFAA